MWTQLGERWGWERAKNATDPGSGRLGPEGREMMSLSYLLSKEHSQPSHAVPILTENCWAQCVCVGARGRGAGAEGSEWWLLRLQGKKRYTIGALLF